MHLIIMAGVNVDVVNGAVCKAARDWPRDQEKPSFAPLEEAAKTN